MYERVGGSEEGTIPLISRDLPHGNVFIFTCLILSYSPSTSTKKRAQYFLEAVEHLTRTTLHTSARRTLFEWRQMALRMDSGIHHAPTHHRTALPKRSSPPEADRVSAIRLHTCKSALNSLSCDSYSFCRTQKSEEERPRRRRVVSSTTAAISTKQLSHAAASHRVFLRNALPFGHRKNVMKTR